ncbi:MAG: nucleotide exchange factor GrpE [Hyphomonadaceae bacterium]|nr:nucleotide exchange factor GrpE [Hyphomonadaceae bacterium]
MTDASDFFSNMLGGMDAAERANTQQQAHEKEMTGLIGDVLLVLDEIDALKVHSQKLVDNGHEIVPARSVATLQKKLLLILKERGVEPIPALGEMLDLDLHYVVEAREAAAPPEQILVESRRGYTRNGRVFRKAEVVVAKEAGGASDADATGESGE